MPRPGRSPSLRGALFLCALSGLLLSLAFPPAGLWPLAWVALVPWIAVLRTSGRLASFLGSWIAGFIFFGALLSWMWLFGASVWIIVALLFGAMLLVWALCVRWIGRLQPVLRTLGIAVLWCGVEWTRGLGQFGFTWGWLGYSQSPAVPLLPIVRYTGTLGLSFAIALVNASLAEVFVSTIRQTGLATGIGRAALGCGVVALVLGGAGLRARGHPLPTGPSVRATVIQGSAHGPLTTADVNNPPTSQEQQHTLDVYEKLTRQAAAQQPALVVWPETTLSTDPEDDPTVATRMAAIARAANVWLLTGGPYTDDAGHIANSAYLYAPTGNLVGRYDKVHLVPFGEYVPFRGRLPLIDHYPVRKVDFVAGIAHTVLQAGTLAIGPMICFESTFPRIASVEVNKGAQVLVVITNDAWFGHTAAAAQHEQIAVFRAVETGRWVLRAASTGISAIIAPDGRVVARAGLYQPAALTADIQILSGKTIAARGGELFGWLLLGLSIAYLLSPFALRRMRPSPRPRLVPRPRAPAKKQ